MENLPVYISIVFGLTTLFTVYIFYKAAHNSRRVLGILFSWLLLQAIVASTRFYTITNTIPPRFMLLVLPPLIAIVCLLLTAKGKHFIDGLDLKLLTMLHSIRIVVEFVLLWLFINKMIPGIMTFEGRNFDIFSGITAPIVCYFVFVKKSWNRKILLAWNICCLLLLVNIVAIAILAAPFGFQKLAFDQPNIAILYFPFVWLPCCVVPIVLLSHLAAIRQVVVNKTVDRELRYASPDL